MKASGFCIWFTGLPCSGKTTISLSLKRELERRRQTVTLLDADDVRPVLCPDLGYSEGDRLKNMTRLAFVAREVVRHGGIAIVATVSPMESHRQLVREKIGSSAFIQVWVDTPLFECERRDVKGMYALARQGKIEQFTGVSGTYEPPRKSDVVCETMTSGVDECVGSILLELGRRSTKISAKNGKAAGQAAAAFSEVFG